MPIVFLDAPRGTYWRSWEKFVRGALIERGLASPDDVALYRICDDVEQAMTEITGFFRNYHSSRFVGERFVIRLTRPVPESLLAALDDEFRDIVVWVESNLRVRSMARRRAWTSVSRASSSISTAVILLACEC